MIDKNAYGLAEDPGLVPSTHMATKKPLVASAPGVLTLSADLSRNQAHTLMHMKTKHFYTHVHKN